ncbi:CDK-activating kinase assembly factor MAT1-domain-containing protein [Massariosphaeria phaeospora]|uniref:RNA polymerase II transcription factor B subunit 3 n=1 Tax=Massariosphaeria phaeospora TaxID=100035 RepID=A0A7C8MM27_9PLEO|nr:CDK-activating kinase assembly factor MAT1-domain-containing protein [Massariosphaeria phaeospora]
MALPTRRASGAPTKRLAEDGGASPLSRNLHNLSLQPSNATARPPPQTDTSSDICPVCKSSRYLNPNMKFLVNPECYHKMCESCVDRIFSHGPAPCPIAGCKRTLRKARFRKQTFEDLKVEREVDIRKRVAKAMNKCESDFETLKDYNDYLETVESLTWNLILKVDVDDTERRLRLWEDAQKAELHPNATIRRNLDPDPSLPSDTAHVVLKKGATQRKLPINTTTSNNGPNPPAADDKAPDAGFSFAGLKKRIAPEPEKPFDPYGGWSFDPQFYVLQEDYNTPWLAPYKDNPDYLAGGYDITDFYDRALGDAFSGFGVFIEEEVKARKGSAKAKKGTAKAVKAAASNGAVKDVDMDDVF